MRLAGTIAGALVLVLPSAPAMADSHPHSASGAAGGVAVLGKVAAPCPAGGAGTGKACAGSARARPGLIGSVVDWSDVHLIRKPGLYGLAAPPHGQRYAIISGKLVRIDATSAKVLSVIRSVNGILD